MNTEYKGCSRCIVTATRPEERPIWERAVIEMSQVGPVTLELHAPDGGWVKAADDTNSIIVPQDTVAMRFNTAAELRELARLCDHMASRLEFVERAVHVAMGGSVALVCKHSACGLTHAHSHEHSVIRIDAERARDFISRIKGDTPPERSVAPPA